MPEKPTTRAELITALMHAGRPLSSATVMFHQAVAERAGLNATDHKVLEILEREGTLTAGQLAEVTGLTSGAVTSIIDRLERRGFVRRVRDPEDRRRVIVQPETEEVRRLMGHVFQPFLQDLVELFNRYSDAELVVLLDYIERTTDILWEAARRTGRMNTDPNPPASNPAGE